MVENKKIKKDRPTNGPTFVLISLLVPPKSDDVHFLWLC